MVLQIELAPVLLFELKHNAVAALRIITLQALAASPGRALRVTSPKLQHISLGVPEVDLKRSSTTQIPAVPVVPCTYRVEALCLD